LDLTLIYQLIDEEPGLLCEASKFTAVRPAGLLHLDSLAVGKLKKAVLETIRLNRAATERHDIG
jgi:hypothetical protein